MKFIKSAEHPKDYLKDDKKEVCFIGRSNVGKSSLINALANQNNLARTSSTPGRTQVVNYFDDEKYRLVDLPGYGFAKASKEVQNKIQQVIENYIVESKNLYAIFQICDANVITTLDQQMASYFASNIENHFVVLNKIDKSSISTYQNNLSKISQYLQVPIDHILLVSAKSKKNIDLLKKTIYRVINEK